MNVTRYLAGALLLAACFVPAYLWRATSLWWTWRSNTQYESGFHHGSHAHQFVAEHAISFGLQLLGAAVFTALLVRMLAVQLNIRERPPWSRCLAAGSIVGIQSAMAAVISFVLALLCLMYWIEAAVPSWIARRTIETVLAFAIMTLIMGPVFLAVPVRLSGRATVGGRSPGAWDRRGLLLRAGSMAFLAASLWGNVLVYAAGVGFADTRPRMSAHIPILRRESLLAWAGVGVALDAALALGWALILIRASGRSSAAVNGQ